MLPVRIESPSLPFAKMVAAACNEAGFVDAFARIAKGDRCVVRSARRRRRRHRRCFSAFLWIAWARSTPNRAAPEGDCERQGSGRAGRWSRECSNHTRRSWPVHRPCRVSCFHHPLTIGL